MKSSVDSMAAVFLHSVCLDGGLRWRLRRWTLRRRRSDHCAMLRSLHRRLYALRCLWSISCVVHPTSGCDVCADYCPMGSDSATETACGLGALLLCSVHSLLTLHRSCVLQATTALPRRAQPLTAQVRRSVVPVLLRCSLTSSLCAAVVAAGKYGDTTTLSASTCSGNCAAG